MELRSARKRKAANTIDNNKENHPLGAGCGEPASKRRHSTDATTQGQSLVEPIPDQLIDPRLSISAPDQSLIEPISPDQSLIEPISAPDQPCNTSPSGDACGSTVPPTGSPITSTSPGTSHRGSVMGLTSLGDKSLFTFPHHEPPNVFGGVPLRDAAFGNVE
jgi:hypothetical protein